MSYNGNEVDGFEALMASVEGDNQTVEENANVEPAVEQTPAKVETQVDEPVKVSEPVEVAPRTETEAPVLRQKETPLEPTIDWEHKFKTIEGMLKARNGEVDSILATKEAELREAKEAREEAERKLAEVPLDYAKIMGEEAYDDLGEDAVAGLSQMMDAKLEAKLSAKDKKIEQLESVINNLQDGFAQKQETEIANQAKTEAQEHDNRVIAQVPEFLSYLNNNEFLVFLDAEIDPLTGASLRRTFDLADETYDSVVVANICKLFKKQQETKQANAYSKEEHLAPSTNSQTPVTVEKPMMKWADYNTMTDKLMNQQISDTEFVQFNTAFELAKSEGRVQ